MSVATAERKIFRVNIDCSEKLPNVETLEAMREIEDMISGKIPSHPQSVKSLFEELGINVHS